MKVPQGAENFVNHTWIAVCVGSGKQGCHCPQKTVSIAPTKQKNWRPSLPPAWVTAIVINVDGHMLLFWSCVLGPEFFSDVPCAGARNSGLLCLVTSYKQSGTAISSLLLFWIRKIFTAASFCTSTIDINWCNVSLLFIAVKLPMHVALFFMICSWSVCFQRHFRRIHTKIASSD